MLYRKHFCKWCARCKHWIKLKSSILYFLLYVNLFSSTDGVISIFQVKKAFRKKCTYVFIFHWLFFVNDFIIRYTWSLKSIIYSSLHGLTCHNLFRKLWKPCTEFITGTHRKIKLPIKVTTLGKYNYSTFSCLLFKSYDQIFFSFVVILLYEFFKAKHFLLNTGKTCKILILKLYVRNLFQFNVSH